MTGFHDQLPRPKNFCLPASGWLRLRTESGENEPWGNTQAGCPNVFPNFIEFYSLGRSFFAAEDCVWYTEFAGELNMLRSELALTLVSASWCFSAIVPVGGAHANSATAVAPPSLSISYASKTGNTVAITCALGSASGSIKTITDTGGSVWSRRVSATETGVDSEIWTTLAGGSKASSTFTVTPANPTPMSCALEEYSGVMALGSTATNSGNSGSATVTIMTQDADNFVIAAISVGSYNGQSVTTGSIRQNGGLTGNNTGNLVGNTLTDNSAATASKVTCANGFGHEPWAVAAVEFRSVRGKKAQLILPEGIAPSRPSKPEGASGNASLLASSVILPARP